MQCAQNLLTIKFCVGAGFYVMPFCSPVGHSVHNTPTSIFKT